MSLTSVPGVAIVLISELSLTDFWNRLARCSTGIREWHKEEVQKIYKKTAFQLLAVWPTDKI